MKTPLTRLRISDAIVVTLLAGGLVTSGGLPVEGRLGLAGVSLFYCGHSLGKHAVEWFQRFRVDGRTAFWFVANVAYLYSSIVWFWWSQRKIFFPPVLLNRHLEVTYFYELTAILISLGLRLELRVQAPQKQT